MAPVCCIRFVRRNDCQGQRGPQMALFSQPIQDQVARFDTQQGATAKVDAKTRSRFACPEPVSNRGIRLDQGRMSKAICGPHIAMKYFTGYTTLPRSSNFRALIQTVRNGPGGHLHAHGGSYCYHRAVTRTIQACCRFTGIASLNLFY
jgi:hypothetical protein